MNYELMNLMNEHESFLISLKDKLKEELWNSCGEYEYKYVVLLKALENVL